MIMSNYRGEKFSRSFNFTNGANFANFPFSRNQMTAKISDRKNF